VLTGVKLSERDMKRGATAYRKATDLFPPYFLNVLLLLDCFKLLTGIRTSGVTHENRSYRLSNCRSKCMAAAPLDISHDILLLSCLLAANPEAEMAFVHYKRQASLRSFTVSD
jgi:hypothetical protein